ncbi:MAG: glycosyltransferase involved in cell wall biosynthesis [Flavobacteriaceae bacterium]|jgi:glycosyltransferase involved in cell wall biosynthesis
MKAIVSIVVPSYNQAQFLDEALTSVFNQSYSNWECIIVNDGSKDNVEEVANQWTVKDARFRYYSQKNQGVSSARNLGVENAEGIYILPLDADDKISLKYLELAVEAFEKDASLKLVYCQAEKFGDESGLWKLAPYSLKGLTKENMIFCSAIYHKMSWKELGGYDTQMKSGLEDWEFWIHLLKNGGNVLCLKYVGFHYRVKTISRTKTIRLEDFKDLNEYLSLKHPEFFVEHLGSFQELNSAIGKARLAERAKLKGKKYVLNAFCKAFFGFEFFSKTDGNE